MVKALLKGILMLLNDERSNKVTMRWCDDVTSKKEYQDNLHHDITTPPVSGQGHLNKESKQIYKLLK